MGQSGNITSATRGTCSTATHKDTQQLLVFVLLPTTPRRLVRPRKVRASEARVKYPDEIKGRFSVCSDVDVTLFPCQVRFLGLSVASAAQRTWPSLPPIYASLSGHTGFHVWQEHSFRDMLQVVWVMSPKTDIIHNNTVHYLVTTVKRKALISRLQGLLCR